MEERNMHQITTGNCGLVLDTQVRSSRATNRHLSSSNKDVEFTGHFILNRYRVDDDGHVCLSPSLPLSELRDSIAVLTAELESLLEQAKQRFPETMQTL
jgi:hypothetical protein